MPLILIDGMEDRSTFVQTAATISIAAGRHGNCLRGDVVSAASYNLQPNDQSDTLTLGFAVRMSALNSSAFISLRSDAGATEHAYITTGAGGTLIVGAGPSGSRITTAVGTVAVNTWAYVEIQVKLHDSTGFVTLRVNGVQVGAVTNVDTKNGGTKTVLDQVRLTGPSGNTDWDDLYLKSGAGETFLGDITVETLYPNGNGNASQWVGSDGDSVNNYLLVDEPGAPVTTDYVKSATVGQIDQYTLTDLAASGTIVGVCHQATVALAAAGSQDFQLVNRRAVDAYSPTQTATSTTYAGFHHAMAVDPETSAAWTVANVNALQTGIIHTGGCTPVLREPFNNFTAAPWVNSAGTIVTGRTGTAAQFSGSASNAVYSIPFVAESDTITAGFAWRLTDASVAGRDLIAFYSDAGVTRHDVLFYAPSSTTLSFTRAGFNLAQNAAITFTQNTWYYIEVQCKLHDATGFVKVRVNGTEVINAAGLDTKLAGTKTTYDAVRVASGAPTTTGQWDDMYLTTGSGCSLQGDQTIP